MTATSATFINGGESIKLTMPEDLDQDNRLVYALEVLFEDEHLALIHKPAGILVSGNSFKTIANALTQNLTPSQRPDATIPQPVHRLDYATTGILLVGKTSSSIRALNKMFVEKTVEKTYHAVTIGVMTNDSGTISSDIDDKESQSDYKVIESVFSKRFGQLNWVELKPKTGRRHQLRKHLASIGHPILGDKDYGIEGLLLNGKGLYLHAFSLNFIHPFTGEDLLLKDELPKKFKKIFIQDQ
ncbi:RluA family pseudouridine synthase [Roseivirga sp.]|uniref:RluA family pseudouridine synthase n=1 Tax=Roseivirga sp. TaxID=1964215 RepID=UPI002B27616A|nr:RluA family pseudouridine synthase [Roseivirga sp.]